MILVLSLWIDQFIILPTLSQDQHHERKMWKTEERLGDTTQPSPPSLFCSTLLEQKVYVLGKEENL